MTAGPGGAGAILLRAMDGHRLGESPQPEPCTGGGEASSGSDGRRRGSDEQGRAGLGAETHGKPGNRDGPRFPAQDVPACRMCRWSRHNTVTKLRSATNSQPSSTRAGSESNHDSFSYESYDCMGCQCCNAPGLLQAQHSLLQVMGLDSDSLEALAEPMLERRSPKGNRGRAREHVLT